MVAGVEVEVTTQEIALFAASRDTETNDSRKSSLLHAVVLVAARDRCPLGVNANARGRIGRKSKP